MKNTLKLFGIIAMAAIIVFSMAACPSPTSPAASGGSPPATAPRTATYVGEDAAGNRYTLEITERLQSRSGRNAYTAQDGDSFKLTVELYNSGNYRVALVYEGTVDSTVDNQTEIKIKITVNNEPLEITIIGAAMTVITGKIVDEEGDPVIVDDEGNPVEEIKPAIVFDSVASFGEWLAAQPANTAATPYDVKLNVSDLGNLKNILSSNSGKYVFLDLSGSTFTSIGNSAFSNCTSLASITIPNSVTSIGNSAFPGCTSLMAINADAANTAYISVDGVLYNKSKTTLVIYPTGKTEAFAIPNGITSIGDYAFYLCASLAGVTIPNSVTSIGYGAFNSCTSLASVTIGNSVTSIGDHAFSSCTILASITIPNSVTSIGDYTFALCPSLTSVILGNSVPSIGYMAFYGCTSLTSITIPNSVTSIGYSAFYDCTSLANITIGSGVTSIENLAFYGCTNLTSVTIPNSVTSIRPDAFMCCTSLVSVTFATGSNIPDANFGTSAFPEGINGYGGNTLKNAYSTGKAGTYTRPSTSSSTWTKS